MFKLISGLFMFPMSQVAYLTIIFLVWISVLIGGGMIIYFHIKTRKNAQRVSDKLKYSTIAMSLVFLDMVYTVLNFGWCRYCLMIFYTIQSTLFIIAVYVSANHILKSGIIKLLFVLNCVLYIAPRIILPDTLANDLYGFSGLIKYNTFWGNMISDISIICSIINILLLIVQTVIVSQIKKRCHMK